MYNEIENICKILLSETRNHTLILNACLTDKCKDLPDLTVFEAQSNCRGYYECMGGQAVPKCCPLGYRYEVSNGCVEDKEEVCDDRCFNEKAKKQGLNIDTYEDKDNVNNHDIFSMFLQH